MQVKPQTHIAAGSIGPVIPHEDIAAGAGAPQLGTSLAAGAPQLQPVPMTGAQQLGATSQGHHAPFSVDMQGVAGAAASSDTDMQSLRRMAMMMV